MATPGGRASEAEGDAADAIADWRLRPAAGPRRRRRPAASAWEALQLSARELRIVLTVLFVLFVTGEAWQVFGRLGGVRYAALIILVSVVAGLLGAFGSRQQASSAAQDPDFHIPVPQEARSTLSRRLRWRTLFEILVVGLAVTGAFLALGVLMV